MSQGVWKTRRAELLEALEEQGAGNLTHLTVPELRSVFMEMRGPQGKQGLGLSKHTLAK